jgi:subtilase family serine protease
VGGTDLTTTGPGGAWVSETAWVGSSGGFSTNGLGIPSYQTASISSSNHGSTTVRNVPDVAAEANTDNYFCANGSCSGGVGGTSLAAPRWAGVMAIANQQNRGAPIRFLNPTLYAIGRGAGYNAEFHDITSGNNFNADSPSLYSAVSGYDLVTGWGSPRERRSSTRHTHRSLDLQRRERRDLGGALTGLHTRFGALANQPASAPTRRADGRRRSR